MARVRLFAAAADAAGTEELVLGSDRLDELVGELVAAFGPRLGRVLDRSSFLIDGVRTSDRSTAVGADTLVDVLPPFAGG